MSVRGGSFHERFRELKKSGARAVLEPEMKEMLRSRGVTVPAGKLCTSVEEASECARGLHYPLVLKMVSDRVLHKTELGGVRLGIADEMQLQAVFAEMDNSFKKAKLPGYLGILVEETADPGIELIVGLQFDQAFGPVIMAGIGGVMTDLYEDVSFRMLPVVEKDIRAMLGELRGRPLLDGYRGAAPVAFDALVETIKSLARFGEEMAPFYESVDFNPLIVTAKGVCIVDAKMSLADEERKDPFSFESPRTEGLECFFYPRSVAVMGASSVAGKIGNVILDSLVNYEFKGEVYPINPNYSELMGLKSYPDLKSLPVAPELLVVVVDLKRMPELLDEMKDLGIKNALIVSGGGKELGGERAQLEGIIARKARDYGIRLIGPNCIGSYDGKSRFDSFFHHHERLLRPPSGAKAFITQSGTWGCSFLESAELSGVSKMVSYGNRVDVDEGDLIAMLAGDPETRVIGSYIEGLGMGRKFLAAVQAAQKNRKPVVAFKTGRNRQSASAAVSHTGAYGGSYHVYRGVLRQHGVVLVDSFHELYAACEALELQPLPRGGRAAMLSNGAGPMVNALDSFPRAGLELVELSRDSVKKMRDHFSFFYLVENPVDVTGSASAADYEFVIETLMDDDRVDIVMPFFVFQDTPLDESIVSRLEAINKKRRKPIIGCAAGGPYTERMSRALLEIGIPVFPDVARWVAAASAMAQWAEVING